MRTLASWRGPVITRASMEHFRARRPSVRRKTMRSEDNPGRLAVELAKPHTHPCGSSRRWRSSRSWCSPASSRPATSISAIISAPSSASSPCRRRYDCIYCVVDMHAITVPQDPADLTRQTREVTAAFLAAGIDPKRHIVFNQCQVPQHAELAWVFNCVARLGWLNRMTQFKEKAGKDRENASVGLYAYPDPDGGRHPGLPRHPCAGRRGPEAASRADPRHRPEVQQRLGRIDCRARLRRRLLPADRAADPGPGDARHVPARRLEEDVEVGPVRLLAHQPHRRCRHHRPEDPQGEDRSRAAALARSRA